MKGRKPTPIEIRRQTGNPQRRPLPQARTVGGRAQPGDIAVPEHFTAHQVRAWEEVTADLIHADLFDKADRYVVEAFAGQMGRLRELREFLNALPAGEGRLLAETVRGTWTSNPLLTQERECAKEVRMLAGELGLTAIARTRLGVRDKKRTGLAGLVGGAGAPAVQQIV